MNIRPQRHWLRMAILTLLVSATGLARASLVDISGGSWTTSVLVRPTSLEVNDFFATSAGTVTLSTLDVYTLTHQQWGNVLASLSTSIHTQGGAPQFLTGDATAVFAIGANQQFTASTYAALGGTGIGAYIFDIRFTPAVVAVPLPLGLWMLLSGTGVLGGLSRRRRRSAAAGLTTAGAA